jgi:hypothetical protein
LITANRFKEIIAPQVRTLIDQTTEASLLQMLLLKSQANFLHDFTTGYLSRQKALEQAINTELINTARTL